MNPLYPLSSNFVGKHEEQDEDQNKDKDPNNLKLYVFSSSSNTAISSQAAAAASSSCSSQIADFATTCFDQTGQKNLHHLHHDPHLQDQFPHQLPRDHQAGKSNGGLSRVDREEELVDQIGTKQPDNGSSAAKYWMSSKMRVMQKMMTSSPHKQSGAIASSADHSTTRNCNNDTVQINKSSHRHGAKWELLGRSSSSSSCSNNNNNNNNGGVRVCSDCNTTTTPLWRSGPQGPKSLCNACGIRQRKARRAMAEAAASAGGTEVAASGKQLHKEKKCRTTSCHGNAGVIVENKMMGSNHQNTSGTTTKVSFDHRSFTLRVTKSSSGPSAFGRVFARDEEEAAILLMELSCGLVHTF